jgi:hypothetical protein
MAEPLSILNSKLRNMLLFRSLWLPVVKILRLQLLQPRQPMGSIMRGDIMRRRRGNQLLHPRLKQMRYLQ